MPFMMHMKYFVVFPNGPDGPAMLTDNDMGRAVTFKAMTQAGSAAHASLLWQSGFDAVIMSTAGDSWKIKSKEA